MCSSSRNNDKDKQDSRHDAHYCDRKCQTSDTDAGFAVSAVLEDRSARELNRMPLSEMRTAGKKTRLRSKWTSDNITASFFDYVLKGKHRTE